MIYISVLFNILFLAVNKFKKLSVNEKIFSFLIYNIASMFYLFNDSINDDLSLIVFVVNHVLLTSVLKSSNDKKIARNLFISSLLLFGLLINTYSYLILFFELVYILYIFLREDDVEHNWGMLLSCFIIFLFVNESKTYLNILSSHYDNLFFYPSIIIVCLIMLKSITGILFEKNKENLFVLFLFFFFYLIKLQPLIVSHQAIYLLFLILLFLLLVYAVIFRQDKYIYFFSALLMSNCLLYRYITPSLFIFMNVLAFDVYSISGESNRVFKLNKSYIDLFSLSIVFAVFYVLLTWLKSISNLTSIYLVSILLLHFYIVLKKYVYNRSMIVNSFFNNLGFKTLNALVYVFLGWKFLL